MAVVNGTGGNDFIHRFGDGLSVPAGYNEVAGVTTGDDTIYGFAGDDFIFGDFGNDIINGGIGADTMDGGAGNDWFFVDNAGDSIIEGAGEGADRILSYVSFVLPAGIAVELITTADAAGTGAINLTGNEFAQTIAGNAGANILDGRGGADTLIGYGGNDWFYVDSAGDSVVEAAGEGSDRVLASVSYTLGAASNVEILSTTSTLGTAAINLTGNGLVQSILGNAGANIINGGGGADTMRGLEGNDTYHVDNAGDVVTEVAGGGSDLVLASVSYTLGAAAEVETLGTVIASATTALNLTGNGFAQTLTGNAGANILNGLGGADTMIGYGGNDWYYVDNAGDQVTEGAGGGTADRLLASVNYALAAAAQIEILTTTNAAGTGAVNLTGNDFAQTIVGNAGNNRLDGRGGNDTLDGGAGVDRLAGGAGDDVFIVDSGTDTLVEVFGEGTDLARSSVSITLAQYVENLILTGTASINGTGNSSYNVLTGNAGANVLVGAAGNDTLRGGAGADSLHGGTGNDLFVLDDAADQIFEAAGEGSDQVATGVSYQLAAGVAVELLSAASLSGTAAINLTGNEFAQTLTGNAGANVLDGRGGADVMNGGNGDDSYYVDNAGDVVVEDATGNDTVFASASVTLSANVEHLVLIGNDDVNGTGNSLNNTLQGNEAANILNGAGGFDTMSGGQGNDTYYVGSIGDVVTENVNEGIDEIIFAVQWVDYTLGANIENLTLMASPGFIRGNDLDNIITGFSSNGNNVNGGLGNDSLIGGSLTDDLNGGRGNDTLTGGGGGDIFRFNTPLNASTNVDTITDFSVGEDEMRLSPNTFGFGPSQELTAAGFVIAAAAQDADDRIIYDSATGNLYYDADGTGAQAQILFAVLDPGLALTHGDFNIASF